MIHVIIPVYRGLAETKRCIESVLCAGNSQPHCITVIDDCSPDAGLTDYLATLAQDGRVQVLRNEQNLGFVATVNRGMELDPHADVILLNSDTEVTGDWLDRLYRCACSAPDIGTVTPFSNNATICSYPKFCEDNTLPEGWDVSGLDALFRQVNAGRSVEIPTAVGFCMYIRRACLDAVGSFDVERFGKGYGEENDFCMRARKRGWRHLLCADTFVFHAGGVSFAEAQNARKQAAQKVLNRRHPFYSYLVQWHIRKDPARPYRLIVDFMRLKAPVRPVVLFVTHRRGGGTERHVQELSTHLKDRAEVLALRPYLWKAIALEWTRSGERFRLYFHMDRDYPALLNFLRLSGVTQVHFHHLFGHSPQIRNLPADLNTPFDFTIHDYYSICPRISLTSTDQRYCGEPDEHQCNSCLQTRPHAGSRNIQDWRDRYDALLNKARRVFAPSRDAAQRIGNYFKGARIVLAPHLDISPETSMPTPGALPLASQEKLRIAVIGAMSQIKGADILERCAILAAKHQLPLQFHLIGYAYKDMEELPPDVLSVHGEYKDADLGKLILETRPHLIWFPAQLPETYSYTLSSALLSGLPIAAPDIGAFPERTGNRPWSWICPWNWSADEWNHFFIKVRKDNFLTGTAPLLTNTMQAPACYRYEDYLHASTLHPFMERDLPAIRHLLAEHGGPQFNLAERLLLNSRSVLNLLLRIIRPASRTTKIFGKLFSPHNRKMLKAWLNGRWPS